MKNSLFMYFFFVLIKLNLVNVMATVSEITVTQSNPFISSSIIYSNDEKKASTTEIDDAIQSVDIKSLYENFFSHTNDFLQTFSEYNGAFFLKVSASTNGIDCGHLTIFRHTKNTNHLVYIFSPSLDADYPLCRRSGFLLEYGNNLNLSGQKIPFSFSSQEKKIIFINSKEKLLCNIEVY